jgi:ribosomal protein L7/L12
MPNEKRFNDIANYTLTFPRWSQQVNSNLPTWFWRMVRENHEEVTCYAIYLMQEATGKAAFEEGLLVWREPIPVDSTGRLQIEQGQLLAEAKVAALEFVLRNGCYTVEMATREDEWRKHDRAVADLKKERQAEVQKLHEQIDEDMGNVQSQRIRAEKSEAKCARLVEAHDHAYRVVKAARAVAERLPHRKGVASIKAERLEALRVHLANLNNYDDEQEQKGTEPVAEFGNYRITHCPAAANKIGAIKAVRAATGVYLQVAKEMVEQGTVFEVPEDKLQNFCLDMDQTSVVWERVVPVDSVD